MKTIKNLFFTLILALGFTQVFAQSTTAKLLLVNSDNEILYTSGQNVDGKILAESNTHFQIVDHTNNPITEIEIRGGDVFVAGGNNELTSVGALNVDGKFDAAAKTYFSTHKNEKLMIHLFALHGENKVEQKFTFSLYLNLSTPTLFLGNVKNGSFDVTVDYLMKQNEIILKNEEASNVISYRILSGSITVEGIELKGTLLANGILDEDAKTILSKSAGKQVTVIASYSDTASGHAKRTALVFTANP